KPFVLWSYENFLEEMRPLIMAENHSTELPATWRKRWLNILKTIKEKEKDETIH
ncbi:11401_t:CDS:1, partial [Gigaspora margarita]